MLTKQGAVLVTGPDAVVEAKLSLAAHAPVRMDV